MVDDVVRPVLGQLSRFDVHQVLEAGGVRHDECVGSHGVLEKLLVRQAVQLLETQVFLAHTPVRQHAGAQVKHQQHDDQHEHRNGADGELQQVA